MRYLDTYRSSSSGGELDEGWKNIQSAWTTIVAEDSEAEIDKEGGLSESELADYGYEPERESGDWERKMKKGKMERAGKSRKTIDELDVLGYYADYYI
jgi:hypothetical protein